MNYYIVFGMLLLWGVFLVCIATFGGPTGITAAGNAATITAVLIFLYGFYRLLMES